MGFLGFGNYAKEGPGVRKNEPEKKRFFKFWEIFGRKFWNLMTLNLLYLLCCLPIVTIGPATAGYIYVVRNYVLGRPVFMKDDFFEAFKKNWKQSVVVWLLTTIVWALDGFSIVFYYGNLYTGSGKAQTFNWFGFVGLAVSMSILVITVFMTFYIYLMMVTFDFKMKPLIKNAFIFAGVGLKVNLLNLLWFILFAALGIALMLFSFTLPLGIMYFLLLTAPFCGLVTVFNSFPLVRKFIIDPYYEEQGIPNPLDPRPEEEDEVIFADDVTQRAEEEERKAAIEQQTAEKKAAAEKAFGFHNDDEE